MDHDITSNISVVELLWALVNLLGLYASTRNIRGALRNRETLAAEFFGKPVERKVAKILVYGRIKRSVLRIVAFAAGAAVGIIAMTTPNPPPNRITAIGVALIVNLFLIPILFMITEVHERRSMLQVRELLLHSGD